MDPMGMYGVCYLHLPTLSAVSFVGQYTLPAFWVELGQRIDRTFVMILQIHEWMILYGKFSS